MRAIRRRFRWLAVASLGLALATLVPATCDAAGKPGQKRPSRYVPSKPTASPYLDLTRAETGVLPNYFTFVRPKLDQQSINRRNALDISGLQTTVQQTQGDILRLTSPGLRPTGTGATHGNLLHYFPELSGATR